MIKKILIVEDDVPFGKVLRTFLDRKGYNTVVCLTGHEARRRIESNHFDLLITDLKLPDDSGMNLLEFSKNTTPNMGVIVMTGYAEVSTAVKAIKNGALDYISKPFRPEELIMIIEQASLARTKPNQDEITNLIAKDQVIYKSSKHRFIQGNSAISRKFNEYLKLVGPTNMCVLIEGNSGTGKEVAANTIHQYSGRRSENFVAVDCGAIPREIASSEFFGHVKGSFTGAIQDKKGHFEAAHQGTLFLDEVGNLSYENQIQLLRALQERKIKPVGSNKEITVDVRIISATNEDLITAVKEGRFREDLYHRLNEFSIQIPSLAERKEDLYLFTNYFLEEANKSLGKNVTGLSLEVESAFWNYHWPGNLRELKNVIKRSVLLSPKELVPIDVIPKEVVAGSSLMSENADFSKQTNEKRLILDALEAAKHNKSKAAKLLKMNRKTLYNKLELYKIDL